MRNLLVCTRFRDSIFSCFFLLSHWLSEGKVYSSGICMYFSPNLVLLSELIAISTDLFLGENTLIIFLIIG